EQAHRHIDERDSQLAIRAEQLVVERTGKAQMAEQLGHLRDALANVEGQRRQVEQRLRLIGNSRLWRGRNALMRLLGQARRVVEVPAPIVEVGGLPAPAPIVDIIIPVYRGLEETRRCIESVLAQPLATQVEVIVIEDA